MTKTKLTFAAAAVALAGFVTWLSWHDDGQPTLPRPDGPATVVAAASGGVVEEAAGDARAAAGPARAPTAARVDASAAADLVVSGETLSRGLPIADLPVTLQWFDGLDTDGAPAAEFELQSDAHGKFVWRGPARTTFGTVRVDSRQGGAQVWPASEIVPPGPRQVALKLSVMPLTRSLYGRVHDADRAPIAGAQLSINGWSGTRTESAADGRYELLVPAQPGYPLLVLAAGYRQRLVQGYMPDDAERREFDIELKPGVAFTGRVVDEAGAPVEGAGVRASGLFGGGAVTDVDGRFVLEGAAPGTSHRLTATRSGFMPGEVSTAPGGEPVEIVLRPGLTVTLRVIGQDAAPIVGARVSVVPNAFSGWLPRGVTQQDGRLRLDDLGPKTFDVIVQKPGFILDRRAVDPKAVGGDVVIALREGRTVSGRVLDDEGAPLPGVSIYCRRAGAGLLEGEVGTRATSDAEGRFEITDLPLEPCTVFGHHKDYTRAEVEGVVGAHSDLVLRMQRAPMVAGRVVDGATGQPIDTFTVQIASDYEVQPLHLDPAVFEGSDGYWQVGHWQMKAGAPLFVEVRADGYASQRVATESRIDAPRDQNVIRMFPGTTLTGVVRDERTGAPLADVIVVLTRGDPKADLNRFFDRLDPRERSSGVSCRTDGNGAFSIESVPAGENRLSLHHADYPSATFGPFQVATGPGVLELQPTLRAGVAVRGRVVGVPDVAGRKIRAFRVGGQCEGAVGPDGAFALRGLGEGRWRVALSLGAGRSISAEVVVGDEDVDGLVLTFEAGTGSIRGTVHGLDRGHVDVTRADVAVGQTQRSDALAFENGAFLFEDLAPGRYRVSVSTPVGLGEGRAEVEVGGGEATVVVDYERRR